ncbi:diaminopimelate epimerase [Denitrovibrio acetiphilus DSM 12809]|uniref:Diaminopimelate epimerase n=1 Tax=Denitrovibrio acetiphilus (strain DSM 12809 / NBRC 114555 / N2460) TaxID=522772 RepID=D4H4C1_DENA2|nr:diaminopimelate epimerase [Denitrovibrio acetiphilus]ADD69250.1 diaminopimelate epimerase [Denitrovibrio acetiphilus DSM 12809]
MNIPFYKMSGAGNDFIFIDNRDGKADGIDRQTLVTKTCARNISVGADGMMLIENSDKADFKWRFYNCDGSEAEMCGNGARCAGRFAYLNNITGEKMTFETLAGIIEAEIKEGVNVKVQLTTPFDEKSDYQIELDEKKLDISSVNTGVPHAVMFCNDIENIDIMKLGSGIRYHSHFEPAGTNTNFCEMNKDGVLRVRTYERGVEGETMACGTGCVACALFAVKKGLTKSPVKCKTTSGLMLTVYLENGKVYLEGEARVVYKGELTNEAYTY